MATVKRRLRRRGGGGPDGTAGASRAVDLSHQTLAKPETRRDSAEAGGCSAAAWRSGARRLNRAAGQEPKGASALLFFVIRVLVVIMTNSQHPAENLAGALWLCLQNPGYSTQGSDAREERKSRCSEGAGGAFASPSPQGLSLSALLSTAALHNSAGKLWINKGEARPVPPLLFCLDFNQ